MNKVRRTTLSVPIFRPVRVLLSAFFLLFYWYWSALHHKTNNDDHPSRPYERIYRSVSLSCRTGSFPPSLRALLVLLPPTPTGTTPPTFDRGIDT